VKIAHAYLLADKFCVCVETIKQSVKLYVCVKSFMKVPTGMLHLGLQMSLFLQAFTTVKYVNLHLFFQS
jgi:hypothetical protein